jgi:hypothetical protein
MDRKKSITPRGRRRAHGRYRQCPTINDGLNKLARKASLKFVSTTVITKCHGGAICLGSEAEIQTDPLPSCLVAAVDATRGTYFVLQYRNCCKKRDVLPHAASGFGRPRLKDALCCSRGRDVRLKTAV